MTRYSTYTISLVDEHVVRLVKAIPDSWSHIVGLLYAPQELYRKGKLALNTRLRFSCDIMSSPLIVGACDFPYGQSGSGIDDLCDPDLYGFIHEGRLPSSVLCEQAGLSSLTFSEARKLVVPFLENGYKGRLTFYCGEGGERAQLVIDHAQRLVEVGVHDEKRGHDRYVDKIIRTILEVGFKERGAEIYQFERRT